MLLIALLACGASTPPPPAFVSLSGQTMGTTWSAKIQLVDGLTEQQAAEAIQLQLDTIDSRMSTWKADSELSLARDSDGAVGVSAQTAEVVGAALKIAKLTDGAFDPTVEPLVELWGFRGTRRTTLPGDAELAAARAKVGWQKVSLQGTQLDTGGTALDLSAIAKGHAADRAGTALGVFGAEHYMVEVGGEVVVHGGRPDGEAWRLGVDKPDPEAAPGTAFAAVVQLKDGALATSGNYRNFYEVDGQRVVHTLDPREGGPVQTDVLSASVVASDCMTADGWATALMVTGPAGLEMIPPGKGIEALLLLEDDKRVQTDGMAAYLAD